jgi:adenylate cyclase class 2
MGDAAPHEIEVKFRLSDRAAFELRLLSLGPRCEGRERERNVLFDDDTGLLKGRGTALRLRTTEKGALLTYKGKAGFAGGVKSRLELESGVEAPERVAALLGELGFRPRFVYEKRRTTWRFSNPARPVVVVDETPLGLFAEIEGTEDAVRALARELGVPESAFIPESYVALWMKAREENPALPIDMVFPDAPPAR